MQLQVQNLAYSTRTFPIALRKFSQVLELELELELESESVSESVSGSESGSESVGVGVGLTTTLTPLLQTSFLPDFTQVKVNPFTVDLEFNLVQAPPALAAAKAVLVGNNAASKSATRAKAIRRIMKS